MKIERKIVYESDLDRNFAMEIASIPEGEGLFECIQCGTCSGTCPMSIYMDYTPRRIVAMTREGFKKHVLTSFTIWLCSSCYSCTVRCPAGIKITDLMYALKRKALEEGYAPKNFPVRVLAETFFEHVQRKGRLNEFPVIMKLYMKSGPGKMLSMAPLGLKLLRTGRMSLRAKEEIENKKEFRELIKAMGVNKK